MPPSHPEEAPSIFMRYFKQHCGAHDLSHAPPFFYRKHSCLRYDTHIYGYATHFFPGKHHLLGSLRHDPFDD